MHDDTKLQATKAIWIAIAFILTGLLASTIAMDSMTAGHVVLGIFVSISGMGATSFVWQGTAQASNKSQEKAKRQALDDVLRDLSDEDLMRLKQRLADGTIDDDVLYEQMTLSADGELVPMERK